MLERPENRGKLVLAKNLESGDWGLAEIGLKESRSGIIQDSQVTSLGFLGSVWTVWGFLAQLR